MSSTERAIDLRLACGTCTLIPEFTDATSSKIPSGSLGRIKGTSPKAASDYVRAVTSANRKSTAESGGAIEERRALDWWAAEFGKVVPSSFIDDCLFCGEIVYRDEGAEHEVYHYEAGSLAIKVARVGTPVLEYQDRLHYSNVIFGDNFEIVGIMGRAISQRIIVSQR